MNDVSRETPPAPESARGVFPVERLALAERYAELLATDGVVRGLIGPREAPRLWERHLLNCAVLAELVPEGATVCDVGSGAGLPAWCSPSPAPTSRSSWSSRCCAGPRSSTEVVAALELETVEVVRGRAEELHGARTFDVVTSRAVAPLDRLLGWSMPLVAPDGALVAMKGSSIARRDRGGRRGPCARLSCAPPRNCSTLGAGRALSTTTVVRVSWADPTRVGWPFGRRRRSGARRRGR